MGKQCKNWETILVGSKITADGDCSHDMKRLTPWKESYDQPRQHIKKQRYYFANKGPCSQGYGFFSSHVWMWELDCEENWAPKNWCFWTVVLEKTLESPLDCKEIQPVNPKGNRSWIFIGRTEVEAETPMLWPPDAKNWLIGKYPDAGKIESGRRRRWERMDGITDLRDMSLSKLRELVTDREAWLQSMGSQRVGHDWATELNWTEGEDMGQGWTPEAKGWREGCSVQRFSGQSVHGPW